VKLINVGLVTAVVGFVLTFLAGIADGRPLDFNNLQRLATNAGINALCTLLVGFLVTGLLPLIERTFGVLTDLSLLELGDAAHPLLQELVRRAPGTYNHSINVASLAEPAAESIGARGLLVRVGAYFHDIGKMLKPVYFVENQVAGANRHETLLPAMSTLIIIAHIKDGADLARQHHLPQPIIDFIEQHHGTTLVEYFFRRASEQQREADPESGDVEESSFRYPGPKPQTREAAVLMLADAVESASRTLVEPTPSRIENLVEEITMKRLLDGQFDECDITLQDLRSVQDSLIKSQIAIYHGRVKYPEQRTA
jgi:putative nucleotidyltransferase with HDIG domain